MKPLDDHILSYANQLMVWEEKLKDLETYGYYTGVKPIGLKNAQLKVAFFRQRIEELTKVSSQVDPFLKERWKYYDDLQYLGGDVVELGRRKEALFR